MPSYFCFSVLFLDPAFHGRGDGGKPEWPPSPLRFFQALVAAAYAVARTGHTVSDYACPAIRWLEEQCEPVIVAPSASDAQPYGIAVPNNDLDVPARYWAKGQEPPDLVQPERLKTMKPICAKRFLDGDTLYYLYRLPEPAPGDLARPSHLRP